MIKKLKKLYSSRTSEKRPNRKTQRKKEREKEITPAKTENQDVFKGGNSA